MQGLLGKELVGGGAAHTRRRGIARAGTKHERCVLILRDTISLDVKWGEGEGGQNVNVTMTLWFPEGLDKPHLI